jgi:chaperonin cofactor prefoldin
METTYEELLLLRLRNASDYDSLYDLCDEAADRITVLESETARLREQNEHLKDRIARAYAQGAASE